MKRNLSSGTYRDPVSHDGIHDALTFLPASPFFYEYLYREIALIERSKEPLTLIRILLSPLRDLESTSAYEISIINFVKALNRSIRKGDLAARIGRYEFIIAISSNSKEANEISNRIAQIWRDEDFNFSYSSTHYIAGDGALSILERLDLAESYSP